MRLKIKIIKSVTQKVHPWKDQRDRQISSKTDKENRVKAQFTNIRNETRNFAVDAAGIKGIIMLQITLHT